MGGWGKLNIDEGQVDYQDVVLSGLGGYGARHVKGQRAAVVVSGLGGATLWVGDSLDARVSGVGRVRYCGTPRIDWRVSGLGWLATPGRLTKTRN